MREEIKDIPHIFYLFLHSKLFYKFGKVIKRKEVITYMFEWRIPKKIRPLILEEMILLGLVKRVDRNFVELEMPKFNEDDCNCYFEKLGIF